MTEPEISAKNAKALMNDTRITILKVLSRRRYTLTELSKILGLAKPTVLYHLSLLENAGYIKKTNIRKWTYYELTDLGRSVLKWRKIKVILIAITVAIMITLIKILHRPNTLRPVPKPLGNEIPYIDLIVAILILVLLILAIFRSVRKLKL